MSLCLFGDALIYIVLPVNAELFGVSLVWVGILLAANRIIRTFTYGWVARLGEWIGLKNLCIFRAAPRFVDPRVIFWKAGSWQHGRFGVFPMPVCFS